MEQFGLASVWAQGDWVSKLTLIFLLAMSFASWMVIVLRTVGLLRARRQAEQAKHFWDHGQFDEAMKSLDSRKGDNLFLLVAEAGQDAFNHHQHHEEHLHDNFNLSDWMRTSLEDAIADSQSRLQKGLAILASVGSTAPFVGLFGTVWGIYHALVTIGSTGQASIDRVAGPVGEALIMTALGLAVAIPAVLSYNGIVRTNKGLLAQLGRFAQDLQVYFVTGARLERPKRK